MIEVQKEVNGYIITKEGVTFKLPRVTKVISYCENMSDSQFYKNWVKRVGGQKKANQYSDSMASLGTTVHTAVEKFNRNEDFGEQKEKLTTTRIVDFSTGNILIDSKKADKLLNNQLKLFKLDGVIPRNLTLQQKRVWICDDEIQVAGELDEIIDINSDVLLNPVNNKYIKGSCIVDLKNTTKQKPVVYSLKWMLQLAAYTLGFKNTQNEDITQAIVACATPSSVNYWYVDPIKLKYYQSWFKKAVRAYISQTPFNWNIFKSNCGIVTNPNGYDTVARINMLPIKLEITNL